RCGDRVDTVLPPGDHVPFPLQPIQLFLVRVLWIVQDRNQTQCHRRHTSSYHGIFPCEEVTTSTYSLAPCNHLSITHRLQDAGGSGMDASASGVICGKSRRGFTTSHSVSGQDNRDVIFTAAGQGSVDEALTRFFWNFTGCDDSRDLIIADHVGQSVAA